MLTWLMKGPSTLKIALLVGGLSLAAGSTAGYITGKNAVKADLYADAMAANAQWEEAMNGAIDGVNAAWEREAAEARVAFEAWNRQNQYDESLLRQLLVGQENIRRDFNELDHTLEITNLGTCFLSPAAVELLHRTAAAANGSRDESDN